MAACAAVLATSGRDTSMWLLGPVLFIEGAGGALIASFEVSLPRSVPQSEYATAAGCVMLAKTVGMTAGSALMMGLLFGVAPGLIDGRLAADGLSLPGGGRFDLNDTASLPDLPAAVRESIEAGLSSAVGVALVPCASRSSV